MLSGQVQALEGGEPALSADLNGADLVYIMAPTTAMLFWLYAQPAIKTAGDLKAKQIAVAALNSVTHTAGKLAVLTLKLDPDSDVVFSAVNNPPAILAALQGGAVQAGVMGTPNRRAAEKAGFNMLVDVAKTDYSYPGGWGIMSRKYINSHQDLTQRYVKSLVQAIAFEAHHPAETLLIMGKYQRGGDSEVFKDDYDLVLPYLRKAPEPDLQGVRNALEQLALTLPQARTADPSSFIEPRFVKLLEDNGFIANLYKP